MSGYMDFVLILCLLIIVIISFNSRKRTDLIDEYSILVHILTETVSNYKEQIFIHKLEKLENTYDLEQDSKTNAKKLFNETYNIFLKECCIEIVNNFLSKETVKLLNKYYTLDGLILFIIKLLKE